ncbi:10213_t:CDS:2, partial [Funneliformis mosseae]
YKPKMKNTIFSPRNYENVMPIAGSVKGKGLPTAPGEIFISHNDQTIASNSTRNHQNYNYEHVVTFKDKALPSVPREISISNNDQKIEKIHQNYDYEQVITIKESPSIPSEISISKYDQGIS